MIAEIKGQNGKIIVYDDFIAISRATFGGFVSQGGFSGERRFFYKDITAVEYKKPTFFSNGYIKIIIPGTGDKNAKVGIFGSSSISTKDQNTLILRAFTSEKGNEANRIYEVIMKKLNEVKSSSPAGHGTKFDELRKLGELRASGVITEQEFLQEKDKLLKG